MCTQRNLTISYSQLIVQLKYNQPILLYACLKNAQASIQLGATVFYWE